MTIMLLGIENRSSLEERHAREVQLRPFWWLVEFADDSERRQPCLTRLNTLRRHELAPLPESYNARIRTCLAELGDGRGPPVVTTFCAEGLSFVSASSLLQRRRRLCQPELQTYSWTTGPGSLIKYLVPRSSQLVAVECVRRALDGLSPLSGPSPSGT
jgi:hypothetical protein